MKTNNLSISILDTQENPMFSALQFVFGKCIPVVNLMREQNFILTLIVY